MSQPIRTIVPHLAEALRRLADDSHLVISAHDSIRYVQFATFRPNLRLETIGTRYLEENGDALSVEQLVWLADHGWRDADDGGNLWREWIPADEDEAAAAAIDVLVHLHGVTDIEQVWFQSPDDHALDVLEAVTAPRPIRPTDLQPTNTIRAAVINAVLSGKPLRLPPESKFVAVVDYIANSKVLELLVLAGDGVARRHAGSWHEDPEWRKVLPKAPARSIRPLTQEQLDKVLAQVDRATAGQAWEPFKVSDLPMYWPGHRPNDPDLFDWSALELQGGPPADVTARAPEPSATAEAEALTPATLFALAQEALEDDLPTLSDPVLLARLRPVAVVDYADANSVLELLGFADDRVFRRHSGEWYEDPAWREVLAEAPARCIATLDTKTLAKVQLAVDNATYGQPWEPFVPIHVSKYWPRPSSSSAELYDWSPFTDEIRFGVSAHPVDRPESGVGASAPPEAEGSGSSPDADHDLDAAVAPEDEGAASGRIDLQAAPHDVPLGQLIPALAALSGTIPPHHVPTSCQSALLNNAPTWERLAASTIGDILRWRGVGQGRADHILRFALRSEELAPEASWSATGSEVLRTRADSALRLVAAWAVHLGVTTGLGDALHTARRPGTPRSVVAAADLLETIDLSSIALSPDERSFDHRQAALDLLASFEGRDAVILERVLADGLRPVPTLEEIGRELGITRERVRQVQVKVADRLDGLLRTERFDVLLAHAEVVAEQVGVACPVTHLPKELQPGSSLTDELFAFLAGPYRMADGWLLRRGLGASPAEVALRAFDSVADDDGIVVTDALFDALSSIGVAPRWHLPLLQETDRIRPLDGHYVRWGTYVQRLTATLAVSGRPMTTDELVEKVRSIEPGVNARTLTNTLARDEFRLVGRSRYALATWGDEDYRGIVSEMEAILLDGPRPISELADDLVERFGVSPASVSIYSTLHPRFVATGGVVRLRGDDEPYEITSTLEETARCYQIDGAWSWRVPVDHDLLRGSGRTIPAAFAVHLGATPTHPVVLKAGDQEIKVGWGMYATIGSLRRRAEELELVEGDWMFVRHSSSAGLTFLPLPDWKLQAATPEERARLLVGSNEDDVRDLATCLGDALGIAATQVELSACVRVLEARGETDVLAVLGEMT